MAAVATYHTIYIFDTKAIEVAKQEVGTEKYILRYITFGDMSTGDLSEYGYTEPLDDYSVYSILIDNVNDTMDIIHTSKHDYNLIFPPVDDEYTVMNLDGSDVMVAHLIDVQMLYTIIIAEKKDGYNDIMFLGDRTTQMAGTVAHYQSDRYIGMLVVHNMENVIESMEIPSRYMISYLGVNTELLYFIEYSNITTDLRTVQSAISDRVPDMEISIDDLHTR